jgi:hypothetical protein
MVLVSREPVGPIFVAEMVWHTVEGNEGSETPAAASTESPAPHVPEPASEPLLVAPELLVELVPPEEPFPLTPLLLVPEALPDDVCVPPDEPEPPVLSVPELPAPLADPALVLPCESLGEPPHAAAAASAASTTIDRTTAWRAYPTQLPARRPKGVFWFTGVKASSWFA